MVGLPTTLLLLIRDGNCSVIIINAWPIAPLLKAISSLLCAGVMRIHVLEWATGSTRRSSDNRVR